MSDNDAAISKFIDLAALEAMPYDELQHYVLALEILKMHAYRRRFTEGRRQVEGTVEPDKITVEQNEE